MVPVSGTGPLLLCFVDLRAALPSHSNGWDFRLQKRAFESGARREHSALEFHEMRQGRGFALLLAVQSLNAYVAGPVSWFSPALLQPGEAEYNGVRRYFPLKSDLIEQALAPESVFSRSRFLGDAVHETNMRPYPRLNGKTFNDAVRDLMDQRLKELMPKIEDYEFATEHNEGLTLYDHLFWGPSTQPRRINGGAPRQSVYMHAHLLPRAGGGLLDGVFFEMSLYPGTGLSIGAICLNVLDGDMSGWVRRSGIIGAEDQLRVLAQELVRSLASRIIEKVATMLVSPSSGPWLHTSVSPGANEVLATRPKLLEKRYTLLFQRREVAEEVAIPDPWDELKALSVSWNPFTAYEAKPPKKALRRKLFRISEELMAQSGVTTALRRVLPRVPQDAFWMERKSPNYKGARATVEVTSLSMLLRSLVPAAGWDGATYVEEGMKYLEELMVYLETKGRDPETSNLHAVRRHS